MHILLVAATPQEIAPVIDFLQAQHNQVNDHQVELLITGIGSVHSTYALTSSIHANRPAYLIQAGIAGSFSVAHAPGSLVLVNEEVWGDMGVEEDGVFRDVFDMQLQPGIAPYTGKTLINPGSKDWTTTGLPLVKGITVNEISTSATRIQQLQQLYNPVIETMEGAAFHYTALKEGIPFIQLRAVSNYIGERDKSKWKMKQAIEGLNEQLRAMLFQL